MIVLSNRKRRRLAKARREQEQKWKALNGPVTVRSPPAQTPIEYQVEQPNVKA